MVIYSNRRTAVQPDLKPKPQLRFDAAAKHRLIGNAKEGRCQQAAIAYEISMIQNVLHIHADGEVVFVTRIATEKATAATKAAAPAAESAAAKAAAPAWSAATATATIAGA